MTSFIAKKVRYRALGGTILLLSTAIAPLCLTNNAHARSLDTVKACDQETLLLPSHPDLRTIDSLYQRYLKTSIPSLDLGVTRLNVAQMLQRLSSLVEQQDLNGQTLTVADQATLNELNLKYRDAIAQLNQRQEHERDFLSQKSHSQRLSRPAIFSPAPIVSPQSLGNSAPQILDQSGKTSGTVMTAKPQPSRRPSSTGLNTEEYARINENPFFVPTQTPLSTFSIDVDTASYSNMRRFLKRGQLPPKDAIRIEEMINYFSYDYDQPSNNQPFSINTEVAHAPWNPKHKLVQIGLKGQELQTPQPSNLVFLVDVSGSMRSPHKLQLLRRSLCLLVREMNPEDRITLVTYAGNAGLVLPPTSGKEKRKIFKAIDQLEAGGSTAGAAGINLAYEMAKQHFLKDGNNRVILATDGDFNVGQSSNAELERLIEGKRDQGIYLSVLGFGQGNYKDSKMEILANKGNGNYAYIDTLAEARKVLVEDLTSTLFTIAKDVKIQVEFNPQKVQAYRLIGYENRLLRDQDFNDDQKDAGEIGAGHTVTALYEVIPPGVRPDYDLPSVDSLKYQQPSQTTASSNRDELMQVKLRYKQPNQSKSQLITRTIADIGKTQSPPSKDMQFASTVAMFGMVLRDSNFKGNSTLSSVLTELQTQDNLDPYRAEFQRLVKQTKLLQTTVK